MGLPLGVPEARQTTEGRTTVTETNNRRTNLMMAVATAFDRGEITLPREMVKECGVSDDEHEALLNSIAFVLFGYLMAPAEVQREVVRAYTRKRWL